MSECKELAMRHEATRVQVEQVGDHAIEVRYCEEPGRNYYRGWRLTVDEAAGLAAWWTSQGRLWDAQSLPVRRLRTGGIVVSMLSLASVEVRGFDDRGRLKLQGCSLPRDTLEALADWVTDRPIEPTPLLS